MIRLYFLIPTIAQGVVTTVAMPALVHVLGASGWGEVALGQAVGSFGAMVLFLGWGVSGPAAIARRRSLRSRALVFSTSFSTRVVLFPFIALACAAIALVICRQEPLLGALGAAGAVGFGLANAWYFVGTQQPKSLILRETLPFTLGIASSVVVLLTFGDPVLALILQLVAPIVAFMTSSMAVMRPLRGRIRIWGGPGRFAQAVGKQLPATFVHLSQAGFAQLPLAAVGTLAAADLGQFAAIDRVQKQLLTVAGPVGNIIVSDLERQRRESLWGTRRQAMRNLARMAVIAIAGGLLTGVIAVPLIFILTVGEVSIGWAVAVLLGVSTTVVFAAGMIPTLCLAPLGKLPLGVFCSTTGLLVGVIALLFAVPVDGTYGALIAIIIGSVATISAQIVVILRADRPHASHA